METSQETKPLEVKKNLPVKEKKGFDKKTIIAGIILVALIAAGVAYSYNKKNKAAGQDALKEKTLTFIRENMVQPGTEVAVKSFEKEGDLYKMTLTVNKQEIVAYVSADGSKFFPQAVDLNKGIDKGEGQQQGATEAAVKAAVPSVDLFVMSQCPYGVQAEKGIIPVIQKLGSKVNFKLKFVNYILHGKKEFDENLFQYCVQKEEPSKLISYLDCYAKSGSTDQCVLSAKVNKTKVTSCVSSTDASLKLTQNFNSSTQNPPFAVDEADNKQFGVQGSPTLVVNGTVVNTGRDSASLLKAICSGFETQPSECSAELSSTQPAPGFGEGAASASTSPASCGQ